MRASEVLRQFAFTDGPVDVERAIRNVGILLNKDAPLPNGISGHLKRLPSGGFEIASNAKEHEYRQRFTLAHELGHYLLHRDLLGNGVDDDTKYRSTPLGELYNSAIDLFHEQQANSFAANLLMPADAVTDFVKARFSARGELPISDVYKHFAVSPSAMRWRIRNLSLERYIKPDDLHPASPAATPGTPPPTM